MKIASKAAIVLGLGILMSGQALAEKPDWAGKGKATEQQSETRHQDTTRVQERAEQEQEGMQTRLKKEKESTKGRVDETTQARKQQMDKERKELGKGSEQGQAMRKEHSRKWWKFWE